MPKFVHLDGTISTWDPNGNNQSYNFDQIPAQVGSVGASKIAGGADHFVALLNDGTVVAWGYNDEGQCNVPAGLSDVVDISSGYKISVAVKSDGTLVGWGFNNCGIDSPRQ